MTIQQAIARAKEMRPTAMSDELLAEKIRVLDDEMAEMMGEEPNEFIYPVEYELKVTGSHADIYTLYLVAQIDLYNQEIANYQNDFVVANTAINEAKAFYRRHHIPKQCGNWRI